MSGKKGSVVIVNTAMFADSLIAPFSLISFSVFRIQSYFRIQS